MMKRLIYFLILVAAFSCEEALENENKNKGDVEGYAPIYAEDEDLLITAVESHPLNNPGKIYVYGSYLFVNERYKGIHVINNADPGHPEYINFIQVLGNVDIAVKGTMLYADHLNDLVAIDINDIENPVVRDRQEGIYTSLRMVPPEPGPFECPDRARKHLILGWEKKIVTNPECYW